VGAWPVYLLLLTISLSVVILSEVGVWRVLRRSALALPFALAALPLVFNSGGSALFEIPLGSGSLTVFEPGLSRFASIAFKSWVSVQVAIVLASTTPFPDLLSAMRAVRVPRLLVAIFSLMWRYLFVMADEVGRLSRARAARSGHAAHPGARQGGTLAWRARVTGGMAGSLFVRSFSRADRIHDAMRARGYDGEVRMLSTPAVSASSWLVLATGLTILGSLLALSFVM
jgi:cobalt/nickel transport system permease protein